MLADFNGDGNIDVGVMMFSLFPNGNGNSFMQVLAGNGDGTFTPTYEVVSFDKFGMPTNAADLNGDGRADLIELDGWPASYHVIPGVPGPTVQLAFPTQPIVGNKGSVTVNLSLIPATSTTVQLFLERCKYPNCIQRDRPCGQFERGQFLSPSEPASTPLTCSRLVRNSVGSHLQFIPTKP